jgi:hypothetical protein
MRRSYSSDLSDAKWACLEPYPPTFKANRRPHLYPLGEMLNEKSSTLQIARQQERPRGPITLQPKLDCRPTPLLTCVKRLAHARPQAHNRAMTEEEIRQRVKEILLKRDTGDELTSQEETILAYAYYAAGEQAVRMQVEPETETE